MRKNYPLLTAALLLAVVLSVSCRKQFSASPDLTPYTTHLVDSLQAVEIARVITPDNMFRPDKPDANRNIENGITVRDNRNQAAYYIFSFADTGFIIISADRNLSPVLAYSNTSKLKPGRFSPGIMSWFKKTVDAVEIVRKGQYDNSKLAAAEWGYIDRRLQNSQAAASKTMRPPPDPDPCETMTHYLVGPLVPVTWGQGCGYNGFCPPDTAGDCGYSYTGCVATSMSQIMAYWQVPASYNWAAMPADYGNYYVSQLMRDAGDAVNMDYSGTGSYALHSSIDDAFKNSFGYSLSNDVGYSTSQVVGNIQINHPVILSGFNGYVTWGWWFWKQNIPIEGHSWVCDGFEMYTNPCSETTFLHMNWGWHEWFVEDDHNGWFRDFDWTIHDEEDGDLHFQYYKRAIVDIIP